MVIQYFGGGSFRFQSGETSLLLDPTNNRLKADVTLRTIAPGNISGTEDGEIAFAGEYETKGIEVEGWNVPEESTAKFMKTAYAVTWEEMRIVFLGHLAKFPGSELLEKMGEPDILVLPAGAEHFLSAADAAKLVKQLEPSFVLPSFAKNGNELAKALGQKAAPEEKLVFKKKDLISGQCKVVILEPKE